MCLFVSVMPRVSSCKQINFFPGESVGGFSSFSAPCEYCILACVSGVLSFCWSRHRNSLSYELLNYVMIQFLLICCLGEPREHDLKKLFVTNLPCFVILVIQDPYLCSRVRGRRTLWAWRGFVVRTFWFDGKQLTAEEKNPEKQSQRQTGVTLFET